MSTGLAALIARIPLTLYVKGELNNPIIDRLSFGLADKILFFTEENRDDKYPNLVKKHKDKIDILEIGLDGDVMADIQLKDKSHLKAELCINSEDINIGLLAQLYHPKGQHIALKALAKLIAEFPQLKLYLLGDHVIEEYRSYRDELNSMVSQYGLDKHVVFTGWRKDALEVVSLMDIMIHPSFSEGFGRAVLEAMALGKPVVASKVGGLRSAIQDGVNGYIIEPGNAGLLAQKLRDLIADVKLRKALGEEAQRSIYAKYLIDDKITRLCDIWISMSKRRH